MLLEDRIAGMLLGVMIGDALGMPVESMTASEIADVTGGRGVQGFIAPVQYRIADTRDLAPASTTDDWDLTVAVARGLLAAGGFDLVEQARAHQQARASRMVGWGGTTDRAVRAMGRWLDSDGREGRDPRTPAAHDDPRLGAGNGPAIKLSPLVAMHVLRASSLRAVLDDVVALARLTHSAPAAMWSAAALAIVLRETLRGAAPSDLGALAVQLRAWPPDGDDGGVADRLELLADAPARKLVALAPPRFSAIDSVPLAIALGCKLATAPQRALLTAVNAGGDADSVASMAGAVIGARLGPQAWPSAWQQANPAFADARSLASELMTLG